MCQAIVHRTFVADESRHEAGAQHQDGRHRQHGTIERLLDADRSTIGRGVIDDADAERHLAKSLTTGCREHQKYSSAGSFDWAFTVGGTSADMNGNLDADDVGRLYLCGGFGSTFNFEIPPSTYTLSPQSSADVFIARYAPKAETPPVEPLAIRTENTELKTKIFPNPLKTILNIKLPEGTGATSLSLYSASGILISTWSLLEATEIDLSEQSSGLYFVKMEFENRAGETLKLLKE